VGSAASSIGWSVGNAEAEVADTWLAGEEAGAGEAERVGAAAGAVTGVAGGAGVRAVVCAGCGAADFTPSRSASSDQLDFFPESVIRLCASYCRKFLFWKGEV